jgi:hypothetical protein
MLFALSFDTSLMVGLFAVARLLLPAVDAWSQSNELVLGASVVAMVFAAFFAAIRAARHCRPVTTTSVGD